jgi:hypothetical protein
MLRRHPRPGVTRPRGDCESAAVGSAMRPSAGSCWRIHDRLQAVAQVVQRVPTYAPDAPPPRYFRIVNSMRVDG